MTAVASSITIGSARSRSPCASSSTTPPPPTHAARVSRGEGAAGAEGHARDFALLDHDRFGPEPLPLRVEQHHAAAAAAEHAARVSRGEGAAGAEGHARDAALLDLDRFGPEPLPLRVEQHHAAVAVAIVSRGEDAPRAEGHARDRALLDLDRFGPEPLPLRVEQHHAAGVCCGEGATGAEDHAADPALGNIEEARDLRTVVNAALQATPGLEGVSDGPCFQCQEHRLVQPRRPHRIRECSQPPRFRDLGPSLRHACRFVRALGFREGRLQGGGRFSLALVGRLAGVVGPQRQPAGGEREHTRDGGGDEEPAAELLLPLGRGLGVLTLATLVLQLDPARPFRWRPGTRPRSG